MAENKQKDAPKADGEKKEARPETEFVALVRPAGTEAWQHLPQTFQGKTQTDAKKEVARALSEVEEWASHIQGAGLEIVVTSARSFKPVLVKVEPQPAKVVIR
jgi:hypothetical protein